jgi:hypothetical protein
MDMVSKIPGVLLLSTLLLSSQGFAQKNAMTFGMNATYFSDWNKILFVSLNDPIYFNPELTYSKTISSKTRLTVVADGFWGEALQHEEIKVGTVSSRMLLTTSVQLEYRRKNFFVGVGPALRYRQEGFITSIYEVRPGIIRRGGGQTEQYDFGAALRAGYDLKITKGTFLSASISYKIFNGINPLSFGVAYGWKWKMKNKISE